MPHIDDGPTLGDILDAALQQHKKDQECAKLQKARYDKIIEELEAVDDCWWIIYPTAMQLLRLSRDYDHAVNWQDTPLMQKLGLKILEIKRDTVRNYIVPAIFAAIRAGYVRPGDANE